MTRPNRRTSGNAGGLARVRLGVGKDGAGFEVCPDAAAEGNVIYMGPGDSGSCGPSLKNSEEIVEFRVRSRRLRKRMTRAAPIETAVKLVNTVITAMADRLRRFEGLFLRCDSLSLGGEFLATNVIELVSVGCGVVAMNEINKVR